MGCLIVNTSLLSSPLSVVCEKRERLSFVASLSCYITERGWEDFLLVNGVNLNVEEGGEFKVKVIKKHY